MSIDEAIENTEREIKRIEGNAGQARAIGCDSYNSHCLQRERVFLETLHQWKAQFPDWKAEPIGDVPLHLWPTLKQKTKPQKQSVSAKDVFKLYKQLDHEGVIEFFELCRNRRVDEP